MSKVTGLANFTKRGQQSAPLDPSQAVATAAVPATTATAQPHSRARAQKSVVAMSFRISRPDWERLHQLAITEGVSINTLTLRGLSKLFEERGLPGMVIN
ncbi:MAG: hypothetical protein H7293_04590 [Candidatus Saccharibacteria bacterium]|nr:hypothetical protein [Rhodoferax sp.]